MRPRPMRRRIGIVAVTVLLVYWAVLFVLTHWPDTSGEKGLPYVDKIGHAGAYAILAWLAAMVLRIARWPLLQICLFVLVGCLVYGAVDEWLQQYTQRTASLWDWLADAVGTTIGIAFFLMTHERVRQNYLRRIESSETT